MDVPVTFGFFRPVILVPAGMITGCPPDQLELFLLHELAHIHRQDYAVNVLRTIAESLLFYHPAVWWVSALVRTERENCCDDMVVAATGNVHGYALALTELERIRGAASEPALAASGGNLERRINRLLFPPSHHVSAKPVAAVGVLLVSLGIAVGAMQSEPSAPPPMKLVSIPEAASGAAGQEPSGTGQQQTELPGPPQRAEIQTAEADTSSGSSAIYGEAVFSKAVFGDVLHRVGAKASERMAYKVAEKVIGGVGERVGLVVADRVGEKVGDRLSEKLSERWKGKVSQRTGSTGGTVGGERLMAQAQPASRPGASGSAATAYDKWLDEDVVYIIATAERDAFLRLQTDPQRDQFIERFWLNRDPTPGTTLNEFREEYYRRITYATELFSWQNLGWTTDRGRIYIHHGPPDEIEAHPTGGRTENGAFSSAAPFQVWRYRSRGSQGSEAWFTFEDSYRTGEYSLVAMEPADRSGPSQNRR